MTMSIAAKHAKGKSAQDKIFGANAAAVAAAAKYGKDAVTNATIGAILDEDEKLVCLPTVEEVFRGLSTNEMIAYAPISGLPEYLDCVLTAAFGNSRPEGYIAAVATAGGTVLSTMLSGTIPTTVTPCSAPTGTGVLTRCCARIWAAISPPIKCWMKTTSSTCPL